MPVLVKALSDRVILAQRTINTKEMLIRTRPIFMLEPLLLGYLFSVPSAKIDVEAVQNCLKFMDTNAMSLNLIDAIAMHGLQKSQ